VRSQGVRVCLDADIEELGIRAQNFEIRLMSSDDSALNFLTVSISFKTE